MSEAIEREYWDAANIAELLCAEYYWAINGVVSWFDTPSTGRSVQKIT